MADDEDVDKFNETLKRMLESPPKPHDDKKRDDSGKTPKQGEGPSGDKQASALLSDIRRLRGDVAFLACVTRQFRDVALAAHIDAQREG